MVGHGCRKSVLPVKPRDRRILGPRRGLGGNDRGKRGRRVVARKLAPPEEIEVILVSVVVVNTRHENVAVRD